MSKFKKIGIFSTLALSGLAIGLGFAFKDVHQVKADGWSEELYAANLVIGYGKAVKASATADYQTADSGRYSFFVRHGYLTNNKCYKYDSCSSDGSTNATFTSNTATDSAASHWKWEMKGGKLAENTEDGVILGITANTPMTMAIDTMTFKGWPNSGKANTYVKRSGINAYLSVQSVTIANTSTEYSQSAIALNTGDTVYFEYIQLSGTGNLQSSGGAGFPLFKFNEYGSEQVEKTINTTEVAKNYYNNGVKYDADADFVDDATLAFKYGVRHGKIEANNVEKFDTISNACDYSQSSDTENTHAAITYGKNLWSANDDGVIFIFKALRPLTFEFTSLTYAGGWTTNVHHTFAIKESGSSSFIIVSRWQYSGATQAVNPILLNTGDELYFEFRYAWSSSPRRSIQDNSDTGNVPTFIFTDKNNAATSVEANTFMAKYMKLATIALDNQGTGQCASAGWYTAAKAAFNAMSADARELFLTDAAYTNGKDRLIAWATANGDTIDGTNSLVKASTNVVGAPITSENNNSTLMISLVVVCVAVSMTLLSTLIIIKKRKHH